MLLKGTKITPPKPKTIIIPRGEGEDLIFTCGPVLSYDEFDKICPEPLPPLVTKTGGEKYHDFNDPKHKERLKERSIKRGAWSILQALKHTEGLVFETVDINNPDTYPNLYSELDQCLTIGEQSLLFESLSELNSPSKETQKQAFDRFVASQAGTV